MTLKPMTCPNCGGTIDRTRLICEYCGTKFDDGMQPLRIETYTSPVRTFQMEARIDNEYLHADVEYTTEYAMRNITRQLADHLKEMLELRTEFDPKYNQQIIMARVRVVDPNYRF